jgi:hypothetical protein
LIRSDTSDSMFVLAMLTFASHFFFLIPKMQYPKYVSVWIQDGSSCAHVPLLIKKQNLVNDTNGENTKKV